MNVFCPRSPEKLVAAHWIKPFIRDRIKTDQFAYVPGPGKGTGTALTLLYHKILESLDKESGAVWLLSVDFSHAFDKLSHASVRRAVIDFSLPKEAAAWISDFLTNRRQRTRVGTDLSAWSPVTSGVPQGSVTGPLLFCMVLDSLSPLHSNNSMIKYADDVSILCFTRSPHDDTLQSEWDNIVKWSNYIGLPINTSKCAVVNFITKKNLPVSPVSVTSDTYLPTVTSLKLLGVTISEDLRWNSHFKDVIAKVSKRLFVIRFLRKSGAPPEVSLMAYKALIRPLMLYCYPAFCNAPNYLFDKLTRLESRAFRITNSASAQPSYMETARRLCGNISALVALHPTHPLRQCFANRDITRRNTCPLRAPLTKTNRFKNSFIQFM